MIFFSSLFTSRPAALIAFYFYTLLPPSYASQLVATGTPDSSPRTNTFSHVSMEKKKRLKISRRCNRRQSTWVTSALTSCLTLTHTKDDTVLKPWRYGFLLPVVYHKCNSGVTASVCQSLELDRWLGGKLRCVLQKSGHLQGILLTFLFKLLLNSRNYCLFFHKQP